MACSFDTAPEGASGDSEGNLSGDQDDDVAKPSNPPPSDPTATGNGVDGGAGDADGDGEPAGDGDGDTGDGDGDATAGDGDTGDGDKGDGDGDTGDGDATAGDGDTGDGDTGDGDTGDGDTGDGDTGDGDGDTGDRCPADVACRCPHLPEVDDPCVETCTVDECAPDSECALEHHGESSYYVCSNPRTWEKAEERCETIDGATLAIIDDGTEDDFIDGVVTDKTWIGGDDLDEEGQWRWADGTLFYVVSEEHTGPVEDAWANFVPNEPNDLGLGNGTPDCLMYWPQNSGWADALCEDAHGYICEYNPAAP